jgi:hypothetical protein
MQMILNDVVVNDTPKFQFEVPTNLLYTVTVRMQHEEILTIPMFIKGVTFVFYDMKAYLG